MNRPVPRDYQIQAKEAGLHAEDGSIIHMATGLGKTMVAGMIAAEFSLGKVLFLAHTDELVYQTCRSMVRFGLWPRVEKADEYRGGHYLLDQRDQSRLFGDVCPPPSEFNYERVIVSSLQTFRSRVEKYADGRIYLMIHDECHYAVNAYKWIYDRLKEYNPRLRILGLTATPYSKELGRLYKHIAYRKTILDAIDDGYLVGVRVKQVKLDGVDDSKWVVGRTSYGRDFTTSSLEASMDSRVCIDSIAYPLLELSEGRQGIVFLPGIKTVESVTAALNSIRPNVATFVHSGVPRRERRRRVRGYEDRSYQFLVGCAALTTGVDFPETSMIAMARPSRSRSLVEQMLGRGIRPPIAHIAGKDCREDRLQAISESPKPDCLVLDFVNTSRFKLVTAKDILLAEIPEKKREYVARKVDWTKSVKDQVKLASALYELEEALREYGAAPPRIHYEVKEGNFYSGESTNDAPRFAGTRRVPTAMIREAVNFLIDGNKAERMSIAELESLIERQKQRICGRRLYGFLMSQNVDPKVHRINYPEAVYLRRLAMSFGGRLPKFWLKLLVDYRAKQKGTVT